VLAYRHLLFSFDRWKVYADFLLFGIQVFPRSLFHTFLLIIAIDKGL
jgi:hypothetical protein